MAQWFGICESGSLAAEEGHHLGVEIPMPTLRPDASESPITIGARVEGRLQATVLGPHRTKWFPAVVAAIHADGSCDLLYDDGEKEEEVAANYVRYPKTEAGLLPPPPQDALSGAPVRHDPSIDYPSVSDPPAVWLHHNPSVHAPVAARSTSMDHGSREGSRKRKAHAGDALDVHRKGCQQLEPHASASSQSQLDVALSRRPTCTDGGGAEVRGAPDTPVGGGAAGASISMLAEAAMSSRTAPIQERLSAEQIHELIAAANIGAGFDIRLVNLAELGRRFPYTRGQPRHTKVMKDAVQKLQRDWGASRLGAAAPAPASLWQRGLQYRRLVWQYFEAWNAHDLFRLGELVNSDVVYQDWEHQCVGWQQLAASEAATFAALPYMTIEVQGVLVSEATLTAMSEFIVRLNNETGDASRGVYVMKFSADHESPKIESVRAYKGCTESSAIMPGGGMEYAQVS